LSERRETQIAKSVSMVVKLGALAFIIFLPLQYAIQLQLLGGIWIIQTLPAIVFGLYTRWLDHRALLLGWLAGIASGTWMAYTLQFKSTNFALHLGGLAVPGYAAVYSLVLNIVVAVIVTQVVRVLHLPPGKDETQPAGLQGTERRRSVRLDS
jgi:solute:Na+ symporter, SSS family